jgi:CheY-like chemotaxis protein
MTEEWLVLVVEDDPLIAMMVEDMLRELGCRPIGPAGSVAHAVTLMDMEPRLDGAVVDCNLRGELVWPAAERLARRRVPFVFSTGYEKSIIPAEFAAVAVLQKPVSVEGLARALIPQLRARADKVP